MGETTRRRDRAAFVALALVLACAPIAVSPSISGGAAGDKAPAALSIPHSTPLKAGGEGFVDVVIYLADQHALANWQADRSAARRAAGISANSKQFADREASREMVVDRLNVAGVRASATSQSRLAKLIRRSGGRVTGSLPAPNVVFARVPHAAAQTLSHSPLVQAIEPVGERTYLNYSIIHGAQGSWHAAGCIGAGASDSCPVTGSPQATTGPANSPDGNGGPDVAVDDQGINDHHDAFDGGATPAMGRTPAVVKPQGAPATNGSLHANTIAAAIAVKDPAHRGNAYGVDKVLDPVAPGYAQDPWMLGLATLNDPSKPGTTDLPEAINKSYSYSSQNALDNGWVSQLADMEASQYGVAQAPAAGNGGPYSYSGAPLRTCYDDPGNATCQYRVQHPCVAFNSLCMGGATNKIDTNRAHDIAADFSSRGPSVGGRKKPDLISMGADGWGCPNGGYIGAPDGSKDAEWKSGSICGEGTSYSAPYGAAGQLLLAGIGVTAPTAQRAVLINSALMLDSEGDGDSSAQEYWTPDVGWGEIDFAQAYADRGNWRTGQIDGAPANNARFFRVNGQSAGDRTTLAWNRRAILTDTWDFDTLGYTTTDLDLRQITLAGGDDDMDVCGGSTTCGVDATETTDSCPGFSSGAGAANVCAFAGSAVHKWKTTGDATDTIEQVRATGAGDSIVKVKAATTVDGQAREDFAIASTEPLVPLATPTIAAPTPTLSDSSVAENENITVTAFATNESSGTDLVNGLDLENVSVAINLPAGVTCVPSPCVPADLGTLTTASTESAGWTIRATVSAAHQITFTATGSRFGETFTSTSSAATLTADSQAPTIDLTTPSGWQQTASNTVSWQVADPLSGVANVTIESSVDGAPFTSVYSGSTATSSANVTAPEGANVDLRARATDQQGNVSSYSTASWRIDAEPPSLSIAAPQSVFVGESANVFVTTENVGSTITTSYRVNGGASSPLIANPIVLGDLRGSATVEVTTTDELDRSISKTISIAAIKRPVTLGLRIAKSDTSRRLNLSVAPATSGAFKATIRCGKRRVVKRGRVSGGIGSLRLRRGMGRCRIGVSFTPSDPLAFAGVVASRRVRL